MNTNQLMLTMFILVIAFGAFMYGLSTNWTWKTQGVTTTTTGAGGSQGAGSQVDVYGYPVTLQVLAKDILKGTPATVNAEVWDSNNNQYVAETLVAGALTTLSSSMPNTFSGYLMVGNDNYVSLIDRGAEVYYIKFPISYANRAGIVAYDNIPTYNESAITWRGYDDGVAETPINYTIGAGETFTKGKLSLSAGALASIGNPDFSRPIAVCFNASGTGVGSSVGDWERVEVASGYYTQKIPRPGFLAARNIIGDCFVLNTGALKDYADYEFKIVLKAAAGRDPTITANIGVIPLDMTYYKNDEGKWVAGWGDESDLAADTDIGIPVAGNDVLIWFE